MLTYSDIECEHDHRDTCAIARCWLRATFGPRRRRKVTGSGSFGVLAQTSQCVMLALYPTERAAASTLAALAALRPDEADLLARINVPFWRCGVCGHPMSLRADALADAHFMCSHPIVDGQSVVAANR